MNIQKAKIDESDKVVQFYWNLIDKMKNQDSTVLWQKEIYPTYQFIKDSIQNEELYILKEKDIIVACLVLNSQYYEGYKGINWSIKRNQEEVLIPHLLAVDPNRQSNGIGKK